MDTKKILAGLGAIVLVGFMIWWGIKNFSDSEKPQTAAAATAQQYLEDMAKKSGGDITKLTPEEQQKVNAMSGNRGAMALAGIARKFR
jgi:predicted negative regulator of RcsB-dependent stress response